MGADVMKEFAPELTQVEVVVILTLCRSSLTYEGVVSKFPD